MEWRITDSSMCIFQLSFIYENPINNGFKEKTIEELIWIYVDWYYTQYLYHHNEQFLDLFDFINDNTNAASDSVTTQIKDYFVLPFMNMKSDEAYYNDLSIDEITEKVSIGIDRSLLSKIERINTNRYSFKLDYLLFCGSLKYLSRVDQAYSSMIEQFAKQEESITERQNALDQRIDEMMSLLSKDKTEEIANQCRQLEKNTNVKFIILLIGMVCILVMLVLAYLK